MFAVNRSIVSGLSVLRASRTLCSVMQDDAALVIEKVRDVVTVGISYQDKTLLTYSVLKSLKKILTQTEEDEGTSGVILYGTGGSFCSGLSDKLNEDVLKDFPYPLSKKLIVAAISGYATNLGFEIALLCDLRVVEETAVMGLNARKDGYHLSKRACRVLVNTVGISQASDIVLCGGNINGIQAHQLGIANRVVACGSSLGQALNLVKCISKFPLSEISIDRDKLYNNVFDVKSSL